jgi:argininosuccinate lyase
MSELTIDEIRSSDENLANIDEQIVSYLDLRNSMNARTSYGGTSSEQTKQQIKYFQNWLVNL